MSCDVITSPRQKSMRLSDLPQYSVGAWTLSRQHLSLLRSSNPPIFGKPPRPDYWVDLAQIWCVGRPLSLDSLHGVLEGGAAWLPGRRRLPYTPCHRSARASDSPCILDTKPDLVTKSMSVSPDKELASCLHRSCHLV